jgi:hypothetical protein
MILYFNAAWLNHPVVKQTIVDHRGQDTFSKLTNLDRINLSHTAWYSRKGANLLPFKNELIDSIKHSYPSLLVFPIVHLAKGCIKKLLTINK